MTRRDVIWLTLIQVGTSGIPALAAETARCDGTASSNACGAASQGEVAVMCSGAFIGLLLKLLPAFERDHKLTVRTAQGPSTGTSPRAIPPRLRAGERCDLAILFEDAIDALAKDSLLLPRTKTRIASSEIAVAVRSGDRQPDISTPDRLRSALLNARSFAYSSSASGVYVSSALLQRLNLPSEVAAKGRRIDGEPVGRVVARGEAEIGFQQLSELLPVAGIALLGKLPEELQQRAVVTAAIAASARNADGARMLAAYLTSRDVRPTLVEAGLTPIG